MPRPDRSVNPLKRWETWAALASVAMIITAVVVMVHAPWGEPSRPESLGQKIEGIVLLLLWP